MLVNVSGNRCISCKKFTQYYELDFKNEFQRIDCGYCGQKSKTVRPGDKCKMYKEAGNIALIRR